MSKTHELSTLPDFWDDVVAGVKTFEIRENDRGFQTGDRLVLIRREPGKSDTSPAKATAYISYVLSGWGLKNGYVALGLHDVKQVA